MKQVTLSILTALAIPMVGAAAVIDAFSGASQSLVSPGGSSVSSGTVALGDSIFSSRSLELQYGRQALFVDSTLGRLSYEVLPATGAGNSAGYFSVIYTSPVPVNLLTGGATAFEVRVESYSFLPSFGPLSVGAKSGGGASNVSRYVYGEGAASLIIPFSSFRGVDLGAVTELRLEGFRIPPGSTFQISRFQTVPEPALGLYPVIPCVFLWRRWRRKPIRRDAARGEA